MQQRKKNVLTAGIMPNIINEKTFYNMIVLLIGAILIWLLERNISNLCTVWELGDEAGYLGNAAYFAGYDWSGMLSNIHAYYAYGYSFFLIPVFWFADTGVQAIQGACIVNIIFVLGIYLIQICIMEKMCKYKNRGVLAVISFIASLYPYIVSNTLKVDCETILTFWYLLCALLLYYTISSNKIWLYGLLGISSAYILFIHTRAFVPIGGMICTLLIIYIRTYRRKSSKKLLLFAGGLIFSYICLNMIKSLVLQLYTGESVIVAQGASAGNMITMDYIVVRLSKLFNMENIHLYILSFLAKLLYICIGTCAMGAFGYIYIAKEVWKVLNAPEDTPESTASCAVQLYLLLGITLMILFQTVSTMGDLSNFTYFFYGRYYEFSVIPLILFGLYSCLYERQTSQKIMCIMFGIGILGFSVAQLGKYLYSNEIHEDTSRIAAFTNIVKKNDNYVSMIFYGTLLLILFLGIYLVVHQKKWSGILIFIMVFAGILSNSLKCADVIMKANDNAKGDTRIAEYIMNHGTDKNIYVIEEPFRYPGYYCRMQVLIKDVPIRIIFPEQVDEIEDNAYILTYKNSEMGQAMSDYKIMEGSVFELFTK